MRLHIICGVNVSCLRPARSATGQESQSADKGIKNYSKAVARICYWTKFMTGCWHRVSVSPLEFPKFVSWQAAGLLMRVVPLHTEDNKNTPNSYGDDGKNNNFIGFLIFSSPLSSLYNTLS